VIEKVWFFQSRGTWKWDRSKCKSMKPPLRPLTSAMLFFVLLARCKNCRSIIEEHVYDNTSYVQWYELYYHMSYVHVCNGMYFIIKKPIASLVRGCAKLASKDAPDSLYSSNSRAQAHYKLYELRLRFKLEPSSLKSANYNQAHYTATCTQ
jgi:hypothetical protein